MWIACTYVEILLQLESAASSFVVNSLTLQSYLCHFI